MRSRIWGRCLMVTSSTARPFTFNGEPKMFISTRADDAKKVFVNGKFVAEASNTGEVD